MLLQDSIIISSLYRADIMAADFCREPVFWAASGHGFTGDSALPVNSIV